MHVMATAVAETFAANALEVSATVPLNSTGGGTAGACRALPGRCGLVGHECGRRRC
jgi:hypothetical protein